MAHWNVITCDYIKRLIILTNLWFILLGTLSGIKCNTLIGQKQSVCKWKHYTPEKGVAIQQIQLILHGTQIENHLRTHTHTKLILFLFLEKICENFWSKKQYFSKSFLQQSLLMIFLLFQFLTRSGIIPRIPPNKGLKIIVLYFRLVRLDF